MIFEAEINFYKKILIQPGTIFDVGCRDDNIFYEISPKSDIHLFDPGINLKIQDKIKGLENVHFNNIGLGNFEGTTDLHICYGSILLRNIERFKGMHKSVPVKVSTIKKYCEDNAIKNIHFLKIDTEGYDFEVMLGAGDMINNIEYIEFEVFPYYANKKMLPDIADYLKGWNIYYLGGKPMNLVATRKTLDLKKYDKRDNIQ